MELFHVLLVLLVADNDLDARDVLAELVDKDLEKAQGEKGDNDADGIVRQQHAEGGSLCQGVKVDTAQQNQASKKHAQLKPEALEEGFHVAADPGVGELGFLGFVGTELLEHGGDDGGQQQGYQNPVSGKEIEGKHQRNVAIGVADRHGFLTSPGGVWQDDSDGVQRAGLDDQPQEKPEGVGNVHDIAASVEDVGLVLVVILVAVLVVFVVVEIGNRDRIERRIDFRGDGNGGMDFDGLPVEEGGFEIRRRVVGSVHGIHFRVE